MLTRRVPSKNVKTTSRHREYSALSSKWSRIVISMSYLVGVEQTTRPTFFHVAFRDGHCDGSVGKTSRCLLSIFKDYAMKLYALMVDKNVENISRVATP